MMAGRLRILVAVLALTAGACALAETPESAGPILDTGGGTVVPTQGVELAPSTRLVVPEGALAAPTPVTVELTPGTEDPLPQRARDALVDYLPTHPLAAPVVAAELRQIGPTVVLRPEGATFTVPVVLEIDLAEVAPGVDVLAVHERADETAEVVIGGTVDGTLLRLPLDHFSTIRFISLDPAGLATTAGQALATSFIVQRAEEAVGPHIAEVAAGVLRAQCPRELPIGYDPAHFPDYLPLLNNLARSEGDIGDVTLADQGRIADWLRGIDPSRRPPATLGEIYAKALELTDYDVFQALVLTHETLRSDRYQHDFIGPAGHVETVRGDGGDEAGAAYHLFGMAVYGFWTEYQKRYGRGIVVSPTIAAIVEEAIVSGDIDTDPAEFVVDLEGAELGRRLFRDVEGLANPDGSLPCEPEEPTTTTTTTTIPEASLPWHFSGNGSMTVSISNAEGFCEIPATMEITLAADGSVTGTLTFAPLDIHQDVRDDGTPYVECVTGPGGTGPITGTFGGGRITWDPGGHAYTGTYTEYKARLVDTWVEPIDDASAAITQVSFVLVRDG